jgi:simple sugar transport system permease protein
MPMQAEMKRARRFRSLRPMERILFAIIVIYSAIVAFVNPAFLSFNTLNDLLRLSSGTMILSAGVLMVLISGGTDVSFTAIAVVSGYTSIKIIMALGVDNVLAAMFFAVILGLFMGFINSLIIHYFELPTFIVTLGTSSVFYGFMTTFIGTKSITVGEKPKSLLAFGNARLTLFTFEKGALRIPVFFIIACAVYLLTWFILYRTTLGRKIFAIGNSLEAAKRVGINIRNVRFFIYSYMGILSAVMGVVYFSEVDLINPVSLVGTELMIIAAVVIGGVRLTGGEGTIFGTILGVLLIQLFRSTLVFLGLPSSMNDLFTGAVMIVSVAIISYRERLERAKKLQFG